MKEQIKAKFDEDGVSPVIGVILMVAVTVALVALVTVIVFDIGGDVSESPDATVEIEPDDSNNDVVVTVLRNENVEDFTISDSNLGSDTTLSGGAGSSETVSINTEGTAISGTVQVIANMNDGSSQVLTTTDYDFS